MRIAMIGSGNVGRALSASSVRAGHRVIMSSANPQDAAQVAPQVGAEAAASNQEAVKQAEVVILAVPNPSLDQIVDELSDALDSKVVIDVTNRVNPQDPGAVLDGNSNAERIQARLPRARVVKAFNTALASRQADPVVDGMQLDGYVAGNDEEAKLQVLDLVKSLGFRPIDAGPLAMARALEAMALLNITLQIRNNWPWQAGWKLVGPTGGQ
jgi:8-hydroxy-5-deazaflavin:NADPH oxidoreductase